MVKSGNSYHNLFNRMCIFLYTRSTGDLLRVKMLLEHMLPTSAQKRCRFPIFAGILAFWHVRKLPLVHSLHSPSVLFSGILKESLIIFEGSATSFGGVSLQQFKLQEKLNGVVTYPSPPTSKKICHDKDQKEPIFEVIESHRRD